MLEDIYDPATLLAWKGFPDMHAGGASPSPWSRSTNKGGRSDAGA